MPLSHRLATPADVSELRALVDAAVTHALGPMLTPEQLVLSRSIMSLDEQLIADGQYFVVVDEASGRIAACGGWTGRPARYGGAASTPEREAALARMPADAARIRAMYTHPDFTRRGAARRVLQLCEAAARAAGFARVELMATPSGEPLYAACGYAEIERFPAAAAEGVAVEGVRMSKAL